MVQSGTMFFTLERKSSAMTTFCELSVITIEKMACNESGQVSWQPEMYLKPDRVSEIVHLLWRSFECNSTKF